MKKNEILKLKRFLEEFSWLMETYSQVDLKKASLLLNEPMKGTSTAEKAVGTYKPKNPNISFLTGMLPSLFLDITIFRTNEDIADFASDVLKLNIPRFDKKSKYEIIGRIVCETTKLNEKGLDKLVQALSVLVNNEQSKKILVKKKKEFTFSWNEMIQTLIKE